MLLPGPTDVGQEVVISDEPPKLVGLTFGVNIVSILVHVVGKNSTLVPYSHLTELYVTTQYNFYTNMCCLYVYGTPNKRV